MQYAIAQNEPMEKRRPSVESDQREKRVGAIFVGFYEDMADGVVLREQRRNLPDEQFKGCTAEQRPAETSDRLNQEQGIEAVFIGFPTMFAAASACYPERAAGKRNCAAIRDARG